MGVIQRQAIRNTIITYAGVFIAFANLLFIQPYFLSTEELGLTRILFAFSSLVSTFLPIGVTGVVTKYFPRFKNPEQKHYGFFGFILLYGAAGTLLVTLGLLLLKGFFIGQYVKESRLFADYFNYVLPLSFFLGFYSILQSYCYSLYKTIVPSLLNDIISRIATIVLSGLYFAKLFSLDVYIIIFVAIYGAQLLVLFAYIWIEDRPTLKVDRTFLKAQEPGLIFRYGLLMSLASVSSLGLKFLDAIMIGRKLPLSDVAVYTIAAFIPTVIEVPLNALEKISAPKLSYALEFKDWKEIRDIYFKSVRYMLLLGGFLFLGINVNADSLLHLIPRPEYQRGLYVILIISLGTLINMATGVNNTIIFASDKYYMIGAAFLLALFAMAFINNLIFIPLFGLEGAALATALSSLFYNALKFWLIKSKYGLQPYDRKTLQTVFLIVFTFAAVYFLPKLGRPVIDIAIRSVLVTIIYAGGTILFRIVPEFHKFIPGLKK